MVQDQSLLNCITTESCSNDCMVGCCCAEFRINRTPLSTSFSLISSIRSENTRSKKIDKLPPASLQYLHVEYVNDVADAETILQSFPFQSSALIKAVLLTRKEITSHDAVKDKFSIEFKINAMNLQVEPGSSFYFLCSNDKSEVEWLLARLELEGKCDKSVELTLCSETKKTVKFPSHLPRISTYRQIFTHHVDIRRIFSKGLLRVLADCCSECDEQDAMLLLSSSSELMDKFVRLPNLSLCDLLHHFPSCKPPVERLLEFLPRLLPRALSVTSCSKDGVLKFVYSLVRMNATDGRVFCRKGLCTGYLTNLQLNEEMLVYLKTPTKFRFSTDIHDRPLILVALGTGIAPFMAFLESISHSETSVPVERYLFFGCRHPEQDHIFKDEMNQYLECGVLKQVYTAYSSAEEQGINKQHVQDKIEEAGAELLPLLLNGSTIIGVCGVNLTASKSIKHAFFKLIEENSGISTTEAIEVICRFEREDRYREELWS